MELTWWGAAGFRIKSGGKVILIDPFLSRNEDARPLQYLKPEAIHEGELIFLSHGHFDHVMDVPIIAEKTNAAVFCSREVGYKLLEKGLKREQYNEVDVDGYMVEFHSGQAEAFFSEHVVFDRKLVLKTLWQGKFKFLKHLNLWRDYPAGEVLSWRLNLEGKIIHFFGSGGSPAEEMEKLASKHTDVLLVPLQGHTDICNIALEYVHVTQPSIVIPHHHDNFFPPISSMVDIEPFIAGVKRECPGTEVKLMELNETVIL
ncbi:MAG: MBL fold metallo-hydrolase [Proteobacteria bacterium]|nr:MBL fold metallo-hydrolase [Pseudomonadota bacterium]